METLLTSARQVLKDRFGYDDFRKAQVPVIEAALNGDDVLAVLPTGLGKSLAFQIPALMVEGTAIVVSPLISLMKDQVDDCVKHGIAATFVNSTLEDHEIEERYSDLVEGIYDLFYIAPERLSSRRFRETLAESNINFIVADEAHCFPPDELISMADGTQRRIDEVDIGDMVIAESRDGSLTPRPVIGHRVIDPGNRRLLQIKTCNGSCVTLTEDHPVWRTTDGDYVEAREIEVGDTLLSVLLGTSVEAPNSRESEVLQQRLLRSSTAGSDVSASRSRVPNVRGTLRQTRQREPAEGEVLLADVLIQAPASRVRARDMPRVLETVFAEAPEARKEVLQRALCVGMAGSSSFRGTDWRYGSREDSRRSVSRDGDAILRRGTETPKNQSTAAGFCYLRPGAARDPVEHRVRRKGTSDLPSRERPKKRCASQETRVVSVAVLERRDSERDGPRGGGNQGVHSITVDVDHNFFAGGVRSKNCTSLWGHDFRIQYSKVWKFRKIVEESSHNSPPLIAVTATATVGIESSIAAACGLKEGYVRVVGDPIRPNLSYNLERPYVSSWTRLRQVAEDRFSRDGWHLVYVGTRNGAETAAGIVGEVTNKPVGFYHAGMSDEAREQTQNDFKSGKLKIICATNAFGMGIDVAQIRTVVHVGIPGSLESYVQETGRAGRDGLHSDVYLFADDYSEKLQWRFFDSSNPSIQLFEQVWAFMHKEPQRHVFRLTARKFAEAIDHDDDAPISTVLSIMDKHGLVRREYTGGDTPAMVHIPSLRAHLKAKLDDREIAIVEALLTRAVRTGADGEAMLQIDVTIGKPFAGKSTMVLKYGEELTDHLPLVDLEAKRVRDMKRLENMIAYTRTTDPKRFIRDYFTSGA